MTGIRKREISLVLVLFVCSVFLFGCNGKQARPTEGENVVLSSAEERALLLKKLGRKFENPDVHFEIGQSFHSDGLWPQAEYHYNIALGFDPAHRPTQAAMVKLLIDSGNATKANNYADKYIRQVSSSWKELLRLGKAFEEQQVDKYAMACYQKALSVSPESFEIPRQMGYYYLNKKNKELAKAYFSQSFQLNHRQPDVARELGRLGVDVRIPEKVRKSHK